jgi:hypothetical protein
MVELDEGSTSGHLRYLRQVSAGRYHNHVLFAPEDANEHIEARLLLLRNLAGTELPLRIQELQSNFIMLS